jgi:Chaperone of endosialidase
VRGEGKTTVNPLIQLKAKTFLLIVVLSLTCLGLHQLAQAVVPAPDGGYPGFNTAEGQNALLHLTTGAANTAVGWFSLENITTGSYNTAVGAGTLVANTGDQNTATGVGALLSNTSGNGNTAHGALALLSNATGLDNTAVGVAALRSNIGGQFPQGSQNTAVGGIALLDNTTGYINTALGMFALHFNTTGAANTACGGAALEQNTEGDNNVALGNLAGSNQTTGSGNVYIGSGMVGAAGENDRTYIRNVYGSVASARIMYVDSDNRIGTLSSSRRYKEEVKPMHKSSEGLFSLQPVTFRYKKDIDPAGTAQFGLIAEDVIKVNADLVTPDAEGKPYSVRYDQVNAMLLNEFLKEHKKVERLQATVAAQQKAFQSKLADHQKEIEVLAASLQKINARLETSRSAPN